MQKVFPSPKPLPFSKTSTNGLRFLKEILFSAPGKIYFFGVTKLFFANQRTGSPHCGAGLPGRTAGPRPPAERGRGTREQNALSCVVTFAKGECHNRRGGIIKSARNIIIIYKPQKLVKFFGRVGVSGGGERLFPKRVPLPLMSSQIPTKGVDFPC